MTQIQVVKRFQQPRGLKEFGISKLEREEPSGSRLRWRGVGKGRLTEKSSKTGELCVFRLGESELGGSLGCLDVGSSLAPGCDRKKSENPSF